MKNKDQLEDRAWNIAECHFYTDDNTLWEPFQDWTDEAVSNGVDVLSKAIYDGMRWAQEDD